MDYEYQKEVFKNRLIKKYKLLKKWARKNNVTCYRLYDKDVPQVPFAIDLYEIFENEYLKCGENFCVDDATKYVLLFEYEKQNERMRDNEKESFIFSLKEIIAQVVELPLSNIIVKKREHAKGGSQYAKSEKKKHNVCGTMNENDLHFFVDLTSYIDSGIFLDMRNLRNHIKENANDKNVLNLFCYTSSFSVYALAGNAKSVTSVDLSNTYLAWSEKNVNLNSLMSKKCNFVKSDVKDFLLQENKSQKKYDIIILDPPTFSNSKMSENLLDINRDWSTLVDLCLSLLSQNGVLYFSTNSRRLKFDENKINHKKLKITDITEKTMPKDFEKTKSHRAWELRMQEGVI